MIKNIAFVIFSILLAAWQISFLQEFSWLRNYLNIVLVVVVFLMVFKNYKSGFIMALVSGLILDIYSPFSFGLITASLMAIIMIVYILFNKLITQKTVYSLILVMIITTLSYHLFFWLLTNLFYWLNWHALFIHFSTHQLTTIVGQIFVHITVSILLMLLVKLFDQQIKSKFLIRNKA